MKSKIICLALLLLFFLAADFAGAAENWMTAASLQVEQNGLVDTVLPTELHRFASGHEVNSGLDLSLIGPDGNTRAFELYMRSSGGLETLTVAAEKETLLDDGRILWEAPFPANHMYGTISFAVNLTSAAGKVDVEGRLNGLWQIIATGTLLSPQGNGSGATISFPEAAYDRVRCYFTGFDKNFRQTTIFVQSLQITGRKTGSDYAYVNISPKIEQASSDNGLEARIFLPGSGLFVEEIEVVTSAQFKGNWQVGREKLNLGRREFVAVDSGSLKSINEGQKLVIRYQRHWGQRVLRVRMQSEDYFGRIEQLNVKVRLPRILFVADQPGEYRLMTGSNHLVEVRENPLSDKAGSGMALNFGQAVDNAAWQSESVLKHYSARGGPFRSEGYTWQAQFAVEKPGFFQLATNEQINLDPYPDSLRIVKDETQIPYFLGGAERRELEIAAAAEYDKAANRSVYVIRLPEKLARPAAIKFSSKGIFKRSLKFEKHDYGQISWQPWRESDWENRGDNETEFTLGLQDFPENQKEIRLTIEHGSNQPLEISRFKGLYSAQDLFFVAAEPGVYSLCGGSREATAPQYDLAIVEDAISELAPERVQPGIITLLASESSAAASSTAASIEQGAPFNDAGYSWVATFPVAAPGFYQLAMNLKAALDSNPDGIRLVRNGLQVPYFPGRLSESDVELKFSSEYDREKNTTYVNLALPVASKQWRSLKFFSEGVFSRNLVLEIRKPGKLGWKTFKTSTWVNRNNNASGHLIGLERLPEGETELRLVIGHGDNSPIELKSVKAQYQSKTLLFQANEAGEYRIYGGNSGAKAANYDLALIKDSLLTREPQKIQLGEPADYEGASQVGKHIEEAFSDRGWGIYAVLGLVTILLLLIIVKIFPEEKKPEGDQPPPPEGNS